jgi:glyoxylase-like metal-dependent hydrolase (beta-lactamase superfamily II)
MEVNKNSYAVKQVTDKIWKLPSMSNMYYLDLDKKIIVDALHRSDRRLVETFLSKVVDFEKVELVILTHFHTDHVGNFDMFPNAKILASKIEIEDFKNNPAGATVDADIAEKLLKANLHAIEDEQLPNGIEVIHTPGHTRGSISLWYPEQQVLFSGDTIFPAGIGRLDLPTSVPAEMQESLNKLTTYNFKILCAGHDYGLE